MLSGTEVSHLPLSQVPAINFDSFGSLGLGLKSPKSSPSLINMLG